MASGVGQALRLDVAWLVQISLDKTLAAPECCHGLPGRRVEERADLAHFAGHLQTAPTAAVGSLDRNREPVLFGESDHGCGVRDRVRGARHQRRADLLAICRALTL